MSTPRTPVVFMHGLWLHSTSWNPWVELFTAAGYDPIAPGWPGEPATPDQARRMPESVADVSMDDAAAHYLKIIETLDVEPVLVGHCFGGLLAEQLLGRDAAAAAVTIDPAFFLPLERLRTYLPALSNPGNLRKAVSLTQEEFRYAFGENLGEQEANELFAKWAVPTAARPLFQDTVDAGPDARGPLLLIPGTPEPARSPAVTELRQFQDRGHALTIDHGWRDVATATLTWLDSQRIGR